MEHSPWAALEPLYVKHFFIGNKRVASKIANAPGYDPRGITTVAGKSIYVKVDYPVKYGEQKAQVSGNYTNFAMPYSNIDMNNYDYPFNRPGYWNGCVPPNNTGTVVIRGNRDSESEETDSIGEPEQRTSPVENLAFYYHTDHLGSTNLVTDRGRSICHATEYLPYGEVFVDLQTSGSDPDLPFKFNGKEMDPETGMLYYGARYYMPKYYQWPTCDPLELKYPGVSSYSFCIGNPINRYDLNGMYSLGSFIAPYQSYSVIAVFPSNYSDDEAINKDYTHAVMAKMPIILVDNILDFGNAMYALSAMGTNTNTYTINSHGSSGDNAHFYIGTEEVSATTSFFNLYEGLKEKNVFIGACNIGTMYGTGYQIVENMAKQTSSTVIAPSHSVYAGYDYDGGYGLNGMKVPYLALPNYDDYIISTKGSYAEPIKNVTIDKYNGIHWDSNPTVVIPYDYQNLSK